MREVSPDDQDEIPYLAAAGQLAELAGDSTQARHYFLLLEAAHPTEASPLLALARWHADTGRLADAKRELLSMESRFGLSPDLLRLLSSVALRSGQRAEARHWSDLLLASGAALFSDRLDRIEILSGRELEAQLKALYAVTEPEEVAALAGWLRAHGRALDALIWLRTQPLDFQDRPDIGAARAECLAALGEWDHLRDDQAGDNWPGHEPQRLLYLARACAESGADPDARAAWTQALLACRAYSDYTGLLDYLDRSRLDSPLWNDARVETWEQIANRFPGETWVMRLLLRDSLARCDSARAQDCYFCLAAFDATDIDSAANGALLGLLRHSRAEESSALLKRLLAQYPNQPAVITASAYDLFCHDRFGEALALLGGLNPDDLNAPARASYVGALLAAAGPIGQARARLQTALAQPGLLDEEKILVTRSLRLLDYREAIAVVLHSSATPDSLSADDSLFAVARSVALVRDGQRDQAAATLAGIDVTSLDSIGLTVYLGGVLALADRAPEAAPYLQLSPDLPVRTALEKDHRAVELWWSLRNRFPENPLMLRGLLAAYRALDREEEDSRFWSRDQPREMELARRSLWRGWEIDDIQGRLHALLRHVPTTAGVQAQVAYALLRQGQPFAARTCMEMLSQPELAQPEPALYYALILAACGDKGAAETYFKDARRATLPPEEVALADAAERVR